MFSTMCSNAFIITALRAFVTANLYFCSYSNAQQYTYRDKNDKSKKFSHGSNECC